MTVEQKIERIKRFRPVDDVFFEVLAKDIPFDQEMLRLILDDEELIVEDVIVQSDERNLYGRSVRLDALCILGNGARCNVEVQRSDNDNHVKRVRIQCVDDNGKRIGRRNGLLKNPGSICGVHFRVRYF